MALPQVYLVRHGQTAWSLSGQHTGRSDIPLLPAGEENARRLADRLSSFSFSAVWSSPSLRARRTGELAGFASRIIVDPDLAEWDYGEYEGLRTAEIFQRKPNWDLFRDGVPNGETLAEISARADRVVGRLRATDRNVLIFSSGHFLRVLGARWLGVDAAFARFLLLGTASISILSYEHSLNQPAIALWNQTPPPQPAAR